MIEGGDSFEALKFPVDLILPFQHPAPDEQSVEETPVGNVLDDRRLPIDPDAPDISLISPANPTGLKLTEISPVDRPKGIHDVSAPGRDSSFYRFQKNPFFFRFSSRIIGSSISIDGACSADTPPSFSWICRRRFSMASSRVNKRSSCVSIF